jgi:hypothetical protein
MISDFVHGKGDEMLAQEHLLTSVLVPTVGSLRLLHSACNPAISFGRFTAGRSVVRRGEGKVEGPVM